MPVVAVPGEGLRWIFATGPWPGRKDPCYLRRRWLCLCFCAFVGEGAGLELRALKIHEQRTEGPLLFESAPAFPPSAGFNAAFEGF